MPKFEAVSLSLTLGIGLVTAAIIYRIYSRKKLQTIHDSSAVVKSWLPAARVSELCIYPIKSCHGVKVNEAECTALGLKYGDSLRDRCFLVIGENNNFLHARIHPKMVLIEPKINGNQLELNAPGMSTLVTEIPSFESGKYQTCSVKVWGQEVTALDCGNETATWFSRYILNQETGARLVYHFSEVTERRAKTKNVFPWMKLTDGAAFHDESPYHLLSEASMQDLKDRLPNGETASVENFRPVIVVNGCQSFAEDDWIFIRIGNDAVFRFKKPNDRCLLTTVDPKTGIKNPNLEPLRTLKKYRMASDPQVRKAVGESPFFGVDYALEKPGIIQVGDIVYVGELN